MKLAIITTNDCQLRSKSCEMRSFHQIVEISKMYADTVEICGKDFKLLTNTKYSIDIEITNQQKLQAVIEKNSPVIILHVKKKCYVAKPNNVLSSSVPRNCDLFYAVDSNGKTYLSDKNTGMRFSKIDGITAR